MARQLQSAIDETIGIARITLDRPERRNALNGALIEELKDTLAQVQADDRVKVVAIAGAGPDFCAGADLHELQEAVEAGPEASLADAQALGDLFLLIRRMDKPVVAIVRGRALAGGAGLATACDMVLASRSASFGYPEVRLGFVPAMVMAILRRSVGEKRAFELIAFGALALSKRLLYQIDGASFEAAIRAGAQVNVIARMTDDCREGVLRFLERSGD